MEWVARCVEWMKNSSERLRIGAGIGVVIALFDLQAHLDAGIPYGGDMLSNLIPALYFRQAIVSGGNLLSTPWYGGMVLWENSFFKGFYPPWSVFFIPGIPVDEWLAVVVFAHIIAAGVVAYWFASRELRPRYAIPIAFIFAFPIVNHNAHVSKTLAWFWIVVGAWQLRPDTLSNNPVSAGQLVGVAGGATLLIANVYYTLYLAILAGCIFLAVRSWKAVRAAAIASVLVSSPKLVSLLVSLITGGRDTILQDGITLRPFISTLIGFWWESEIVVWQAINKDAYAVVSLPICLLAVAAFLWSYADPDKFPVNWMLGCVAALLIGLLIATASPLVYRWPGMSMFRVPQRGLLIIAVVFLLVSVELIHAIQRSSWGDRKWIHYALTLVLIIGVFNAAVPPLLQNTMWESGTAPTVGRQVASSVESHGCEPVWLETNAGWVPNDKSARHHKQIAYGLAEQGIPAVATSYAKIGQDYSTHNGTGGLTFEALILQGDAQMPPNQTVTLTGGWFQPDRGRINTSQFEIVDRIDTPRGAVRIYAVDGVC